MSTLQVANLWFEATGNNRIQYDSGANGFNFIAAGSNVATINTTGFTWTGNTVVNTSSFTVGNSTVNSTAFATGNSVVNAVVTATSLLIGNSTVNTSINTSAVFLGNSSANVVISPSSANTMTINGLTVGYLELPQNSQSTSYTAVLADSGKHILHPSSDNNARTFTIPANASVPYPVGTALTFVNAANTLTIAITSDTMYLSGDTGTTGSRTLGSYGMATALKIASTTWIISGSNLT